MHDVTPKVYCIGEPMINVREMAAYLQDVGGQAWFNRVFQTDLPAAEGLVEFMGRLCYKSWEPGLNKNVTKVREDRGDYLLNILKSSHGSVLEHAMFNFVIHNGSRVFTAEMNRHRAGVAISEQSLRYVRLDESIPFRLPHRVLKPESIDLMRQAVDMIEGVVSNIYEIEGIDSMEAFAEKKAVTSAVRRIAPLGMGTEEGWSANIRTLRHVIEMRTNPSAEEEIREIVAQIAQIMIIKCPLLFGDYEPTAPLGTLNSGVRTYSTAHRKV
jgi:thymidylate synthase (FAD)